jgi:hypothetical protein
MNMVTSPDAAAVVTSATFLSPLSSDGGEILFDVHKNGVLFVVASLKNKKPIAFFDFL